MDSYDLNHLKLLARGGEADIYDLGGGKILRLSRKSMVQTAETEQQLFQILEENHISVPHLYEAVEIGGRQGRIMQKISGESLMEHIVRHPLMRGDEMKKFVSLQLRLGRIKCGDGLYTLGDMFRHFLAQEAPVSAEILEFMKKVWKELPQENFICHGDFHPGNILLENKKYYLIDWSGAYRGRFAADIAHSYILMKQVPVIPGQNGFEHTVIKYWGARFASAYFREVQRQTQIDLAEFSKWTVIMSFLRSFWGMEDEKPVRIRYLEQCCKLNDRRVSPEKWFQYV